MLQMVALPVALIDSAPGPKYSTMAPVPPAGVRRVAVGADHHPAREGVVLEDDLVDDPASGPPEADAVAGRHRAQELVDLGVDVEGELQVGPGADLRLDEVVAVHRGGHGHLGEP